MNNRNFTDELLELLDEPIIVEKIRLIVSTSKTDQIHSSSSENLADKTSEFELCFERAKKEYEDLSLSHDKITKELGELHSDSDKMKVEFSNLNSAYEKIKKEILPNSMAKEMYIIFKNLDISIKNDLKGIFKNETYENFIACGCQKENINTLWEFIKSRISKDKYDQLEELNKIFLYFIECYNNISDTPTLTISTVEIGDIFDTSLHIRDQNSKSSGKITNIYLFGYQNSINKKIINKSIVRVI